MKQFKSNEMGSINNRAGNETKQIARRPLDSNSISHIKKTFKIGKNIEFGAAVDDGGCFFDALAQVLNITKRTNKYNEKSLRMLCYNYYLENKEKVDGWNNDEFAGLVQGKDDYFFVQYTKEELDSDFNRRPPIWGRPSIEGRILCQILVLKEIAIIGLLDNRETNSELVCSYDLVTKDGAKNINIDSFKYNENTLMLSAARSHFVPILPQVMQSVPHSDPSKSSQNHYIPRHRHAEKRVRHKTSGVPKKNKRRRLEEETHNQGKKEKAPKQHENTKPGYVVNMPLWVESDEESGPDSDSESYSALHPDKKASFPELTDKENEVFYFGFALKDRNSYPFRLQLKKVKKTFVTKPESKAIHLVGAGRVSAKHSKSEEKLQQAVDLYSNESFGCRDADSRKIVPNRLSMIIGLNRRESIDRKRNRNLRRALNASTNSKMPVDKIGFFWRNTWEEKNPDSNDYEETTFEKARAWYEVFKEKNKNKAKNFRKNEETREKIEVEVPEKKNEKKKKKKKNQEKRTKEVKVKKTVPMGLIRDEIKDHPKTKEKIAEMRANNPNRLVYLGTADGDNESLRTRAGKPGLFSHYDNLIQQHMNKNNAEPTIMSSGYTTSITCDTCLDLAVEMDLQVRNATAKHIPLGVYFPEPNMVLKVLDGENTISESFQCDGEASNESKHIVKNMVEKRDLTPLQDIVFDAAVPIITEMPVRFKKVKNTKKDKEFEAEFNRNGRIIYWAQKDLSSMVDTPQSHVSNMAWAKYIVHGLDISGKFAELNGKLVDGIPWRNRRNILVSIISRLFKCFNPIKLAELRMGNSTFVANLAAAVKEYGSYEAAGLFITTKTNDRERSEKIQGNPKLVALWKCCDEIVSVAEFKRKISSLLNNTSEAKILAEKIVSAARDSGKAIRDLLEKHLELDFIKYIKVHIQAYFHELGFSFAQDYHSVTDSNDCFFQMALKNDLGLDLDKLHVLGTFGLLPIHIAAITGNKELAKKIIKKAPFQVGKIAECDVTPLHLALHYCALHYDENGEPDAELVKLFLNDKTVQMRRGDGLTPLVIALTTIETPLPIIEQMLKFKDVFLAAEDDAGGENDVDMDLDGDGLIRSSLLEIARSDLEKRELILQLIMEQITDYALGAKLFKVILRQGIKVTAEDFLYSIGSECYEEYFNLMKPFVDDKTKVEALKKSVECQCDWAFDELKILAANDKVLKINLLNIAIENDTSSMVLDELADNLREKEQKVLCRKSIEYGSDAAIQFFVDALGYENEDGKTVVDCIDDHEAGTARCFLNDDDIRSAKEAKEESDLRDYVFKNMIDDVDEEDHVKAARGDENIFEDNLEQMEGLNIGPPPDWEDPVLEQDDIRDRYNEYIANLKKRLKKIGKPSDGNQGENDVDEEELTNSGREAAAESEGETSEDEEVNAAPKSTFANNGNSFFNVGNKDEGEESSEGDMEDEFSFEV